MPSNERSKYYCVAYIHVLVVGHVQIITSNSQYHLCSGYGFLSVTWSQMK